MKFRLRNLTNRRGIAQIPLIVGLLLMAVAIPVVTKLTQQEQDTRQLASVAPSCIGVSAGSSCGGYTAVCCGSQMFACAGGTWTSVQNCSLGCKADRSGCVSSCAYAILYDTCGACGSDCPAGQKRCKVRKSDCSEPYECISFVSQCPQPTASPRPTSPPSGDCGVVDGAYRSNGASWCSGSTQKSCAGGSVYSNNCAYGCSGNGVCNPQPTTPPAQQICTPNSQLRCLYVNASSRYEQQRCNSAGTGWNYVQTCAGGCSGNLCAAVATNTPVPQCTGGSICKSGTSCASHNMDPGTGSCGSGNVCCVNRQPTATPVLTCVSPNQCKDTGGGRANCASYEMTTVSDKTCQSGYVCCAVKPTPTPTYSGTCSSNGGKCMNPVGLDPKSVCVGRLDANFSDCAYGYGSYSGYYPCCKSIVVPTNTPIPGTCAAEGGKCMNPVGLDSRSVCSGPIVGNFSDCAYGYGSYSGYYPCCKSIVVPTGTPVPREVRCCCGSNWASGSDVCNWYSVPVTGGCSSLASLLRNAGDEECTSPRPTITGVLMSPTPISTCISSGGKCIGNYPCDLGYEPSSKGCVSGVCCVPSSTSTTCISSGGKCIGNYPCDLGYEPSSKGCVSGVCCVPSSTLIPTPTVKVNPGSTPITTSGPVPTVAPVTPVPTSTNAPPPAPTNPPGPPPATCDYSSLQARVQVNSTVDWQTQLTLAGGEKVNLGCMHNGSGQLANNVAIVVEHSSGTKNEFTKNLVEQWSPPRPGNYTVSCRSTDSKCSGLVSSTNATLSVGSVCKECPNDFHCYGPADDKVDYGYRWFATGYVQEGWVTQVPDNYCVDYGGLAKPQWLGKAMGDANCDGKLDLGDVAVWRYEFADLSMGEKVVRDNWEADFTGVEGKCDGVVDIGDYSLWRANFNRYFANN